MFDINVVINVKLAGNSFQIFESLIFILLPLVRSNSSIEIIKMTPKLNY